MMVAALAIIALAICVHHPVRSEVVKHTFWKQTGYPHGRPGYVVDHVKPLCLGGKDAVENMQWQTIADAKVKNALERKQCALACRGK